MPPLSPTPYSFSFWTRKSIPTSFVSPERPETLPSDQVLDGLFTANSTRRWSPVRPIALRPALLPVAGRYCGGVSAATAGAGAAHRAARTTAEAAVKVCLYMGAPGSGTSAGRPQARPAFVTIAAADL